MIQTDKRFKFTICLLIMQALPSSVEVERTNGRNALQTLQDDIRMHEKHNESKYTQENTVFRITGEAYELDDFCQIYDSLHGHSNPEEMLSIITIRDIHVNKHYSSEDYMQYFIKGIQEYINQNEHILLQNILGITVNCVKRAHITEFEHLNINLELNYTIRQRVREYIINHFHDICLDGTKEIFVKQIYLRFERQQQFFTAEISTDEATLNKICNKDFNKVIAGMKQFVASYNFHKELQWNFEAKGSAFDVLYSQICDHETNLGVKNFTDNRADLMTVYSFILKEEFMELYKDGINHLATMYFSIFDMQYCRKVFGNHYKAICKRLLNHFTNNWPYNDYIYSEMCMLYCTNDYFTSKIQSFFTEIQSNDIKKEHLEKYRDSLDLLRQKTKPENVTKILYNGRIDNEKISLLLDILQHYEIFDKPYRHQTVYIDSGRGLTEIEALACAKKCNELVFECSDAIKTVELITIIRPTLGPLGSTPMKCFKHKREVISTCDKFRQSFENILREPSETKITIGKFFNSGSAIDACIFCHWIACLIRNDSVPRCSKMVSFENNFTSSFVIILLHKHNNTKQEIISLIYNMPYTSHSICDETICNDKRLIQCMDNVPLSFLKKLSMSIQSEQYWKSVQFNNPNLASRCNYDIVFSEDFLSIYYMRNKSNILDSYLATFYKPQKKHLYKMRFSISKVEDFERKGKYDNPNLASTADYLKITHAEFNQLLLKFLSNKGFHALERTDPTEIDYLDHSGEIDFLLSIHKNTGDDEETVIFNLVETHDKYYALQPKFNPIKNLSRIIDLSKNILSIQRIECAMKNLDSKTSFIGLVLCDVCMQTKYIVNANGEPSFPMGKKECFGIILKQLENVLQMLYKTKAPENCSGELVMKKRQKTEDLQKDIVPTELEAFAEIIARELNHSTRYSKLRIMSMKLEARNQKYYQRKEFIDSHKIYEQYEDLKRWTDVFISQ